MLQYVYSIDKANVLGYECDQTNVGRIRTTHKQGIISRKDREFFHQTVRGTQILMGGNTLYAILAENNGKISKKIFPEIVVYTRDEELVKSVEKQGVIVQMITTREELYEYLIDNEDKDVSAIGGAYLFHTIEDLGIHVDRHIVTEFDCEAKSKEDEDVVWVSFFTPPGSCKTGEIQEGWFRRQDCKKFEDVDQHGEKITGWFAEYEVL